MRRETRRFEVASDNGRRFTLIEYQTSSNVGTKDNRHATMPGLKELFTSDGEAVNVNDEGTYEIVGLGVLLRRIP